MYTKLIVVALLACFASSFALSKGLGEKFECLYQAKIAESRIGEGQIREAVEKIRQQMKDGFPGYPPLDPLDVTDYHMVVDNDYIKLDSNLTAKSTGLAGFVLKELSLSLIGLNLKFTVNFPPVTASGIYSGVMSSSLLPQDISGKGDFGMVATGFTVKGKGKIATKLSGGKIVVQIKKLEIEASLADFACALTIENDEETAKQVCATLTNLPSLLVEYRAKVNEMIEKALPYVNDYLAGNSKAFGVTPVRC